MWTDRDGNEIEIETMSDRYLLNAQRYAKARLKKVREQLKEAQQFWMMVQGDHAERELEQLIERGEDTVFMLETGMRKMEAVMLSRGLSPLPQV
jgi:hypothetical protein